MSIEFETIADNCTPRNALFCCRSPVCLNNSPKLVPVSSNTAMDAQYHEQQSKVFPVRVPDLSDAGFYTSLMTQPCNHIPNNESNSTTGAAGATTASSTTSSSSSSSKPAPDLPTAKMLEINKSQSAQDVRTYGVSLRRVTPPKTTVAVKKSDNPMMNVVLRKVFHIYHCNFHAHPAICNSNAMQCSVAIHLV